MRRSRRRGSCCNSGGCSCSGIRILRSTAAAAAVELSREPAAAADAAGGADYRRNGGLGRVVIEALQPRSDAEDSGVPAAFASSPSAAAAAASEGTGSSSSSGSHMLRIARAAADTIAVAFENRGGRRGSG